MENDQRKKKVLIFLSFLAIYFIWGSTYLAIILALKSFPPFLLASLRFLIAGFILFTYCLITKESQPNKNTVLKNFFLGIIVLVGGQGLLIWSEQYISSGNAAILVATLPIWFVFFDHTKWKEYFKSLWIILGVIFGFVGTFLLFFNQLEGFSFETAKSLELIAYLAVIISVICWVVGSLYHRSFVKSGTIFSNLSIQLLFAGFICLMLSFSFGELNGYNISKASLLSWGAIFYLAIAGSLIAFVAFTWLLTQKSSVTVGTYAYINPIIAVFLGWLFLSEKVSALQQFAMFVIIGSAFVINKNRS